MASHEESIPDLIRGTIRDGIGIVRDEILLARTEMREEVVRIKSGLITVVAAVGVGVLAVIMLITLVGLLTSDAVKRVIGHTAMTIVERIMGILLAAMSAEMILAGLKQSGVFYWVIPRFTG